MIAQHLLVALVLIATVVALGRWRVGVFLAILVGIIQDPLRKLTPGTPPILVLASVPIWIAVYVGVVRGERRARLDLRRTHPGLSSGATLFAASLLVPAFLSLQYGVEGWQMAVLGLFGYVSPVFGVLVGFAFARRAGDVRRLLIFYSAVCGTALLGTAFEYLNAFPGWAALGTSSLGAQWVRTTAMGAVELYSGFFRSPDIMGWHAAAAVMLSVGLVLQKRARADRIWLVVAAWGGVCLLLAGRRKMMMMTVVWAACLALALVGSGRLRRAIGLGALGLAVALSVYYASAELDVHQNYYVYAGTVTSEGPLRVVEEAWYSVWVTYDQAGFLGRGLGSASQGARYLSGSVTEGWQESGPSKVMAELGVPGFVCALLLLWRVAGALRGIMRAAMGRPGVGVFCLALIGFVVANVACFTISHQVYSDALILTLTSLLLGAVLGAHRWALAQQPNARPHQLPRPRIAVVPPVQRAG